jgi:hypothetical protein
MNFPSTYQPDDAGSHEFEVILEDGIKPESESPAKPATAILVIIPRGIRFKVDVDSYPGATCVKIPVEEQL